MVINNTGNTLLSKICSDYETLDYCVDIHTHPTTYPLLIQGVNSPWDNYDRAPAHRRMHRSSLITRGDFTKLLNGKIRVAAHYLHIPERYILGKVLSSPLMMEKVLKMDRERMRQVLAFQPFKMLNIEYEFLLQNLTAPNSGRKAVIAHNFKHLQEILKDPDALALILSIEGGHNLGFECFDTPFITNSLGLSVQEPEPISENLIKERIRFCKENHVLFLTLNHFVYNHLATMPKAVNLTGIKRFVHNPIHSLQHVGHFRGLTYWGVKFVEECMQQGVILDIKHCDAISRKQIYDIAQKFNRPVIGSHIAVSGKATNINNHTLSSLREDQHQDRNTKNNFNPWDINLHDDDILSIHKLGGLLGLINDVRVLASFGAMKYAENSNDWVYLIYAQIRHIYQVLVKNGVNPANAFDTLCIGGDLDGMIDPINTIPTVEEYLIKNEQLKNPPVRLDVALIEHLHKDYNLYEESGLSPQTIVHNIMKNNAMNFLSKYFI